MSITIKAWLAGPGADACSEALGWLKTLPSDATMSDAWMQCRRSDWMRWAAMHSPLRGTDERWRLAGCAMVRRTPIHDGRTVWDLLTDPRSRNAVEVAERFARGEATDSERDAAGAAAWDAARAAAWAAAWDAAGDAARAAARDAAGAAAGDAAWAAAGDAQKAMFIKMLHGEAPWQIGA